MEVVWCLGHSITLTHAIVFMNYTQDKELRCGFWLTYHISVSEFDDDISGIE